MGPREAKPTGRPGEQAYGLEDHGRTRRENLRFRAVAAFGLVVMVAAMAGVTEGIAAQDTVAPLLESMTKLQVSRSGAMQCLKNCRGAGTESLARALPPPGNTPSSFGPKRDSIEQYGDLGSDDGSWTYCGWSLAQNGIDWQNCIVQKDYALGRLDLEIAYCDQACASRPSQQYLTSGSIHNYLLPPTHTTWWADFNNGKIVYAGGFRCVELISDQFHTTGIDGSISQDQAPNGCVTPLPHGAWRIGLHYCVIGVCQP
jgi:hypothetical protein